MQSMTVHSIKSNGDGSIVYLLAAWSQQYCGLFIRGPPRTYQMTSPFPSDIFFYDLPSHVHAGGIDLAWEDNLPSLERADVFDARALQCFF